MAFEQKTPPIKIKLDEGFFNLMLEVLENNKSIELDDTNLGAERLMNKLLKYPRVLKNDDNKDIVSIVFFPREASDMINQLLVWLAVNTDIEPKLNYFSKLAEKEINKAKEE